ncbi:hypothetical protein [Flavobacterium aquidurense]|uniref:Uncharacterized protein n=1 Tax=Flavobacterium aquidurense TaxID=362413 RepID=A0A0Q0S1A9_9FLAO|nr:hypothetical protein [Flavobacterium aquidurense]KQB38776.1 hypothetical protein RC62_2139 [Flavobacterium aquidurense]
MINKITQLIREDFVDNVNWYSIYFNEQAVLVDNTGLEKKLNDALLEVSKFYIESILSGEYIKENNFETKLLANEESINLLLNSNSPFDDLQFYEIVFKNFVTCLQLFLTDYSNFFKVIDIHNTHPSVDVVFSSSKNISTFPLDLDEKVRNSYDNFSRILKLNQLDHFFDEGIGYFKDLIELEKLINNSKYPSPFDSAVILKLSFLKYKWSIRQITTLKALKRTASAKSYLVDNVLISLQEMPTLSVGNSKIIDWKVYLENHYDSNNLPSYFYRKYDELKLLDVKSLTFYQLHFFIKYHTDIKPNYENLTNIVKEIERRESGFTNEKERFLFYKNLNYAFNNQFSLLVQISDSKKEEVEKLRNKIVAFQSRTSNENFFVEVKYLKFKIKSLEKLLKGRKALDTELDLDIKVYLEEIRLLFAECESKINWSKNHHNLLYQLKYEESLVPLDSGINDVYFASSFLLPLSAEQIDSEFQELRIKFNNDFNHLEVLGSLTKEFTLIKDLKSNVESTDKKSIETITIYTAVISFIVGTVSGFSFVNTFFKALIFLLVFSSALSFFVLMVFVSTRGVDFIKRNKKHFFKACGFLVLLLAILCFFNHCENEASQKEMNVKYNRKIDSLNTIYDSKINLLKEQLKQEIYKKPDTLTIKVSPNISNPKSSVGSNKGV